MADSNFINYIPGKYGYPPLMITGFLLMTDDGR